MQCPACGLEQTGKQGRCQGCGVDFAKYRILLERRAERERLRQEEAESESDLFSMPLEAAQSADWQEEDEEEFSREASSISREGWIALGIGLVIALGLPYFPFINFLLHPLVTLFHEIGHAFFSWLTGIPAIPSFDFVHGGGVTRWFRESPSLPVVFLLWAGMGYLLYHYRQQKLSVAVFSGILVLHGIYVFSWIHEPVILFMGEGMVLVLGGVFLYRGLSGWGCVHPTVERPLYAGLGLWAIFGEMRFAYGLLHNGTARYFYRLGKGGMQNDFIRIADIYRMRTTLEGVASFLLVCAVVTLILTFLLFRYRRSVYYVLFRIFSHQTSAEA